MAKAKKYVSPRGVAVYPWLNKPDTREFNGQPSKPAYKVQLRLEGADAAKLKKAVDGWVEESFEQTTENLNERIASAKGAAKAKAKQALESLERHYPYEPEYDDEGNETGAVLFKFKQNAEIKQKDGTVDKITVPLFDAKGKPMKELVYGGSEIKISFTQRPYHMASSNTAGTTLDLKAVQVLELVSSGGGNASAFGFEEEDGFEASDDDDADDHGFDDDNQDGDEDGEDEDF